MIYDQIKQQALNAVPFAQHVGIVPINVNRGTSEVQLSQRREVSNHIDTLHAGALFSLGEAASGLAMAGALSPVITSVRPVAASASIRYLKTARGTITAVGRIEDDPDTLVARLKLEGTVQFAVIVTMRDEASVTVADMTVEWHVRMKV